MDIAASTGHMQLSLQVFNVHVTRPGCDFQPHNAQHKLHCDRLSRFRILYLDLTGYLG